MGGNINMSKRIEKIDRAVKMQGKVKQAISEGKSKEEIRRLIISLNQIELDLDNVDNFRY